MSSNKFQYSALALLVFGATQANAALYKVVEVNPSATVSGNEYHASAIEPSTGVDCFDIADSNAVDCAADSPTNTFALAGDTRNGTEGFSYREEVPYMVDNHFYYLDRDDLESYCHNELGYNTCNSWADRQWSGINGAGGLSRERNAWNIGSYTSNAVAFKDTTAINPPLTSAYTPDSGNSATTPVASTANTVVNKLAKDAANADLTLGNTSSGYYDVNGKYARVFRNRGFVNDVQLLPLSTNEDIVKKMGQSRAWDSALIGGKTYVVGSASVSAFDYGDKDKDYLGDLNTCLGDDPAALSACQHFEFANKAYIWEVPSAGSSAEGMTVSGWTSSAANHHQAASQASARAVAIDKTSSNPYMVGFNTWFDGDNVLMQAAVFKPNATFDASNIVADAWTTSLIQNAQVEIGNEYVHSNSVATDINENLIVIGTAKRRGDKPESGAAANRLFVADASQNSVSASFLSGGIFFTGAGGEMNAINNMNEIVGRIDIENIREKDGKQRRQRAFIYPYSATGTDSDRRAIFSDKAWLLDDLTNGGSLSTANNEFRIYDATDINDAGVISATALKCEGGYDTIASDSFCGKGNTAEKVVAVKLIPIADENARSIQSRPENETKVERQGAGVGWLALTLLGFIGFRRRMS